MMKQTRTKPSLKWDRLEATCAESLSIFMCGSRVLTQTVLSHTYTQTHMQQVTGRARLAGQPVGVIAVETGIVSKLQPADPGA